MVQVGGARPPPAVPGAFGPGGAATAPLSRKVTRTVRTPRRPNSTILLLYGKSVPKSRPDADSPDAYGRCLSRLLSAGPRPRTAGAGPGPSSAEAGPRWSGQESEHRYQMEEQFWRSFSGDALTRHLALDCGWKALGRVFCQSRGVSRNRSRPHWTKTDTGS